MHCFFTFLKLQPAFIFLESLLFGYDAMSAAASCFRPFAIVVVCVRCMSAAASCFHLFAIAVYSLPICGVFLTLFVHVCVCGKRNATRRS